MFGFQSKFYFKLLIAFLINGYAHCYSDTQKETHWPNPTCVNNFYSLCEIHNVKQYTKEDFNFQKSRHDGKFYSTVRFKGSETVLNYLPNNLFTVFSGVEHLEIVSNQLLKLVPGDFINATDLGSAKIIENLLTEIEDHTFAGAKNIYSLFLFNNKITTVSKDAFSDLINLKIILLDGNKLTHMDSEVFANNLNLGEVSLAVNNLDNIDFIRPLTKLFRLSVDNNRMSFINPELFVDKTGLKELYLNGNCLSQFDFEKFPIKSLHRLTMANNYFTEIPYGEIKSNYQIGSLMIENNNFNCTHLQTLLNELGTNRLRPHVRSTSLSNRDGIICKIVSSDKDIHVLEAKCMKENETNSPKVRAVGKTSKNLAKIGNGI